MLYKITKFELLLAQIALLLAILLQVIVWKVNHGSLQGPQLPIVITELVLAAIIGLSINTKTIRDRGIHHNAVVILLGLISAANISSLIIVLHSLIIGSAQLNGLELLASALAIFVTNIIIFALWYWEIDSPGLTQKRWSKHDKDFQFIQQDMKQEFADWKPQFPDYLYLSVTNAINFAPADARPLTHQAKFMMGLQALVSVFTLALVIARSVSILGT
jgi:uncharacterized membrane protein